MPNGDNARPTTARRVLAALATFGANVWSFIRRWFWQGLCAAFVLAFILVIVRPFAPSEDPNEADVAVKWNQSIAKLGILPIYPPEEDFYVGDVWGIISEADIDKPTEADKEKSPLLGKSVRVSYIDLRKEMQAARDSQPVFADTTKLEAGDTLRREDALETLNPYQDGRIRLSLTAFPGVNINHASRTGGSLGWAFGGLGAGREEQLIEQFRIPVAETYGVPANGAIVRLIAWCGDSQTKLYCSDAYVRRLLSYVVNGDALCAQKNGRYTTRVQIRLVTRVFLTRQLQQRRLLTGAGGAALSASTDRAGQPANPAPLPGGGTTPPNTTELPESTKLLNALATTINGTSSGGVAAAKTTVYRADGTEISIDEVFQRPVAFGYRAVTVDLTPFATGPNGCLP